MSISNNILHIQTDQTKLGKENNKATNNILYTSILRNNTFDSSF